MSTVGKVAVDNNELWWLREGRGVSRWASGGIMGARPGNALPRRRRRRCG